MACLEGENERLRAENERLRAMLGLPAGERPEADVEADRLPPEGDPLPQVDARPPRSAMLAAMRKAAEERASLAGRSAT